MTSIWRATPGGTGQVEQIDNEPIAGDLRPEETAFRSAGNTLYRGQNDGSIFVYTQSSTITDIQVPVATLFGPLPNLSQGETGSIVIDYTDNVGINLATLSDSSLTVADGGTNAAVVLSSTSSINSGKGYRALFNVTPPSQGTYAVNIAAGYEDLAGNQGSSVSLGDMTVSDAPPLPDTTSPIAALSGTLPSTIDVGQSFNVIVNFTDETQLNESTIAASDLVVTDGTNNGAVSLTNTSAITNGTAATFSVSLPVAGTYALSVQAGSYADSAGNVGAGVNLGSVIAQVVTTPTTPLSAQLTNAISGPVPFSGYTVSVDYLGVDVNTIDENSLVVLDRLGEPKVVGTPTISAITDGQRAVFPVTADEEESLYLHIPAGGVTDGTDPIEETHLGVQELQRSYPVLITSTPATGNNYTQMDATYFSHTFDWTPGAGEVLDLNKCPFTTLVNSDHWDDNSSTRETARQRIRFTEGSNLVSVASREHSVDSFLEVHAVGGNLNNSAAPKSLSVTPTAGNTYEIKIHYQYSLVDIYIDGNLEVSILDSALQACTCINIQNASNVTNYRAEQEQPPADIPWPDKWPTFAAIDTKPAAVTGWKGIPDLIIHFNVNDIDGTKRIYIGNDHAASGAGGADLHTATTGDFDLATLGNFSGCYTDVDKQTETPFFVRDSLGDWVVAHSAATPEPNVQSCIILDASNPTNLTNPRVLLPGHAPGNGTEISHLGYANLVQLPDGRYYALSLGRNGYSESFARGKNKNAFTGTCIQRSTTPDEVHPWEFWGFPQLLSNVPRQQVNASTASYLELDGNLFCAITVATQNETFDGAANGFPSEIALYRVNFTNDGRMQFSRRYERIAITDQPWQQNSFIRSAGSVREGNTFRVYSYTHFDSPSESISPDAMGIQVHKSELDTANLVDKPVQYAQFINTPVCHDMFDGPADDIGGRAPDTIKGTGISNWAQLGGGAFFDEPLTILGNGTCGRDTPTTTRHSGAYLNYSSGITRNRIEVQAALTDLDGEVGSLTTHAGLIFDGENSENLGLFRARGDGFWQIQNVVDGSVASTIASGTLSNQLGTKAFYAMRLTPTERVFMLNDEVIHSYSGDFSTTQPRAGLYTRRRLQKFRWFTIHEI